MGNFIATCSAMFRNGVLNDVPPWYDALFPITDWPLHILHAERGSIGYIREVMGVYRFHSGGYYSPFSEREKLEKTLSFYEGMNANLGYRYDKLVKTAVSKYFFEWAAEFASRGNAVDAKVCFQRYLAARPINAHVRPLQFAKLCARLYAPWLLRLVGRRANPVH
jgi:hypothetical protein